MDATYAQLTRNRAVAVIRRLPGEILLGVVDALVKGGIQSLEVTMDAADAPTQIESLVNRHGDDVLIGAGTVFTVEQAKSAVQAGARFLVSPHLDVSLLERTQEMGVPFIPGVMTPSEIHTALAAGAKTVKVFPANVLGPSFVRDILGPFSSLSIMATGGLTDSNVAAFLRAGASVVGLGSFLFPQPDVINKDWQKIEERVREVMSIIHNL